MKAAKHMPWRVVNELITIMGNNVLPAVLDRVKMQTQHGMLSLPMRLLSSISMNSEILALGMSSMIIHNR